MKTFCTSSSPERRAERKRSLIPITLRFHK
ncbi:MAG: hypothetical protein KME33_33725 [Aetokthonos hydrillicola CCALA 1050]|nr:hypothetical protein [Aetokthonos hydrillicola CCALA 1050]